MPIICSNDARMKVYDFMNRASYRDTYSALGSWKMRDSDCFRLSECPRSVWDRSQPLKMPLAMVLISSFLMKFSTFVLPMPALFNPCFDLFCLLMYYGVY